MKFLIAFLFKLWSFLLSLLPYRVQLFFGKCIGWLWFDVIRLRRQIVLDNLKLAFPDMSLKERIRLGRKSVENTGTTFIEFLRIFHLTKKDKESFSFEGLENLRAAQAKGRGVLILTQHIGNGDWATVGLALNGIPLYVITKAFKMKSVNDVWFQARRNIGTKLIGDRNTSYAILKALKKNGVVAFMLDQFMGPPIGVKTRFFGVETGTAMGLAVLARRSKASVVPVYTYRKPSGHTIVHFDPEIEFIESDNPEDTIRDMTQIYCDKVEEYVRKFPEQWMWVHRRWKKYKY